MALTKAQRAARRAEVLEQLREAWWKRPRPRLELTLQRGRRRPRVAGVVRYVATTDAFVLLGGDDWPDDRERMPASILGQPGATLHVPVDVIRSVRAL